MMTLRGALGGFVVALCFLTLPVASGAQCPGVDEEGNRYLNILTINILFSQEPLARETSLDAIADFAANEENDVHIIFLQEVVGGLLVGTKNSAKDLQAKLKGRGLTYELRTAVETGVPGLLAVANATLSRCDILYKLVKRLPRASEIEFRGLVIKLPRNVLMTRLRIPGFGKMSAYNTHLCAGCLVAERGEQLDTLLGFVNLVEWFLPGRSPVLLAGDFNIDRFREPDPSGRDSDLYDDITLDANFRDTYAASQADGLEALCEHPDSDPNFPDEHCTFGVAGVNPFGPKRRIDYVFDRDFGAVEEGSRVVFNPQVIMEEPTVSDHAGGFIRVWLP